MVAVDAIGCLAMGFDPAKVLHLNMAAEKGLGISNSEKITTIGEVEEIRHPCKPREGMDGILLQP